MAARSDLVPRVIVGVILIAVAVAAIYLGGLWFGGLVAAAILLMFAEWSQMHRIARPWRIAGLVALAGTCGLANIGAFRWALEWLALGAALLAGVALGRPQARGAATGALYAGLPAIALIWLRGLFDGAAYVLWTLAIVWATDIGAYFAGRAIGGPKLAPRFSPNKTWAGLAGGAVAAAAAGAALSARFGWSELATAWWYAGFAATGALLAQTGDLYESWLKRRAGVKDSGNLLPGHGGVMDRLDGVVPVACAVALAIAVYEAVK